MKIECHVYWRTEKGTVRITHCLLDEDDIKEAVRKKENREQVDGLTVKLETVTIDAISM